METMNPYYIVKTAEDFYSDEAVAPIIGALIGGGIGAYTGKGWKSKLLRGLAGAGIGGGIGMGANWIRNRLGYGQAAEAQREQFNSLQKELADTQKLHSDVRNDIKEIYRNLYGFIDYDLDNKPTLKDALTDITQSLGSRKIEQRPIGYSEKDYTQFKGDFKPRNIVQILTTPEIQLNQDNRRIREDLLQPVFYETFKPIKERTGPTNSETKPKGELQNFTMPKELPNPAVPSQKLYTDDFISPIIGALLGGGIGAFTGKDKKSTIKRGIIGLLLGGGAGLGVNWLRDKLDRSNFQLDRYKARQNYNEYLQVYNNDLFNIKQTLRNAYDTLGGTHNNRTLKEMSELLKKYTNNVSYNDPEALTLRDHINEYNGNDTYLGSVTRYDITNALKEIGKQEDLKAEYEYYLKGVDDIISGNIKIDPRIKNTLKGATKLEILTAIGEEMSDLRKYTNPPITTYISAFDKLGYNTDNTKNFIKDYFDNIMRRLAYHIKKNRDPNYENRDESLPLYPFEGPVDASAPSWKALATDLQEKVVNNWERAEGSVARRITPKLQNATTNRKALSKDKIPTIDEY